MRQFFLLSVLVLGLTLCAGCAGAEGTSVYLSDYITGEMEERDVERAVRQALEACRGKKNSTLVLPGGTLKIRPEYCFGEYMKISNNNPGDKKIAFLIEDFDGLHIEGNGTTLLFTGYVSPFVIRDSRNVSVSGLNIDFERTFHSEGVVTAAGRDGKSGSDWIKIRFEEEYGAGLESGILVFKDSEGRKYPYNNLLEYNSELREVAQYVRDHWCWGIGLQAEKTADGDFKVYQQGITATVGNVIIFGAAGRYHPAFTLDGCDGFTLTDVNIWHCGGMGVIAQRSRDLELNRVNVVPSPGKDRMISITADATHFINCKGYIRMTDCVFMNQKDDASNIHGWYSVARKKVSENALLLWSNYGVDFAREGMRLELVDHNTMMTYDTLEVASVFKYNDELSVVTFTEAVPERFAEKDVLADVDANPDVLISGCRFGNNRARGLLIGSRGKVIIEDNYFHVPGAAILLEGDGNYWFEQSGVRDLTIRNNVFENCLYGCSSWGKAYIAVGSGIPVREGSRYHRNITIVGNTFNTYDPRILNLYCVDGVDFHDNTVTMNEDYRLGRSGEKYVLEECDRVRVEE